MSKNAKDARKKPGTAPKPYKMTRLGILNPNGNVWTVQTFDKREQAKQYIRDFWRGIGSEQDISNFKIVPVTVTVAAQGRSH